MKKKDAIRICIGADRGWLYTDQHGLDQYAPGRGFLLRGYPIPFVLVAVHSGQGEAVPKHQLQTATWCQWCILFSMLFAPTRTTEFGFGRRLERSTRQATMVQACFLGPDAAADTLVVFATSFAPSCYVYTALSSLPLLTTRRLRDTCQASYRICAHPPSAAVQSSTAQMQSNHCPFSPSMPLPCPRHAEPPIQTHPFSAPSFQAPHVLLRGLAAPAVNRQQVRCSPRHRPPVTQLQQSETWSIDEKPSTQAAAARRRGDIRRVHVFDLLTTYADADAGVGTAVITRRGPANLEMDTRMRSPNVLFDLRPRFRRQSLALDSFVDLASGTCLSFGAMPLLATSLYCGASVSARGAEVGVSLDSAASTRDERGNDLFGSKLHHPLLCPFVHEHARTRAVAGVIAIGWESVLVVECRRYERASALLLVPVTARGCCDVCVVRRRRSGAGILVVGTIRGRMGSCSCASPSSSRRIDRLGYIPARCGRRAGRAGRAVCSDSGLGSFLPDSGSRRGDPQAGKAGVFGARGRGRRAGAGTGAKAYLRRREYEYDLGRQRSQYTTRSGDRLLQVDHDCAQVRGARNNLYSGNFQACDLRRGTRIRTTVPSKAEDPVYTVHYNMPPSQVWRGAVHVRIHVRGYMCRIQALARRKPRMRALGEDRGGFSFFFVTEELPFWRRSREGKGRHGKNVEHPEPLPLW
ncbi:hypothetical protein B0H16DRAFT_1840022 [Mycena metata]|uniref:Uncharacterized protein n=1 Tax=Mycena metata TaxID=1033252 RepID=A0AAD7N9M7_9AGAR|nr:hypothetical protein B0H16DRAFT_1840022 [Mycena metata]